MSAGGGAAAEDAPPLFAALAPHVREGAAYAADPRRGAVYAFGGVCHHPGGAAQLSGELHRFDVLSRTWAALPACDVPECASGVRYAALLCHGDALYVFGGNRECPPHYECTSPDRYRPYSPGYRPVDTATPVPKPEPLCARFDLGSATWRALPKAAGNGPNCCADRYAHCATLPSGVAVVLGNSFVSEDEATDVSLFTFATQTFSTRATTGMAGGQVAAVCASACGRYVYALHAKDYGDSYMCFMRLDSQTWAWEPLSVAHTSTSPAHLLPLPCGDVLALGAGGFDGLLWESAHDAWRPVAGPNPNGGSLSGVSFAATALVGDQLLLLGGVHKQSGDGMLPVLHAQLAGAQAALQPLAHDLRAMLDAGTLADVRLLADGGALPAHRAILVARSAYFRAMLQGGCKEGSAHEVLLPAVSVDALRRVLQWLYTGHVALHDGDAQGVLEAASLFALDPLLQCVVDHVRASLRLDNALPWLLVARARGVAQLQAACLAHLTAALQRGGAGGERLLAQLRASPDVPRDLLVELLECVAMGRAGSRKRGRASE